MDFWSDNQTGRDELKELFPQISALAMSKQEPVSSFGQWEDGTWHWMVQLRKRPLDWDLEVWDNFNHILEEVVLDEKFQDKII